MEGFGRGKFFLLLLLLFLLVFPKQGIGLEILSKSKIEKCEKLSDSDKLDCKQKIVLNMAVPSGSSGGEASVVAELVEAEDNTTNKMQTLRNPPVITVNKSAAYALYEITYIRDVPYKPVEFSITTRKCKRDASAEVVKICERLRDEHGNFIDHTQPICCPCGPWRRAPSSCGNFFDKLFKGKANTAHCLRFPGDWFHVFGIGRRSLGFSVRIEVKKGSKTSQAFETLQFDEVCPGKSRTIVSAITDHIFTDHIVSSTLDHIVYGLDYISLPSVASIVARQGLVLAQFNSCSLYRIFRKCWSALKIEQCYPTTIF
ncbi:hypothetical protein MRB53_023287 [Persea americana]|uniref:Uncharacterized protein n=1 Tax=Persea americana TaxID=3435 RepID=A0ACC2L900_PERAE|nr:hypothetical protein MRB53_023287 [Persea americana]